MKQPEPLRPPAPATEPVLKVGLILERDTLSEFTFTLPHTAAYLLEDASNTSSGELPAGKKLTVKRVNKSISILDEDEKELLNSSSLPVRIIAQSAQALTPQGGLKIEPVIAGRDFHWKKAISATFPGAFEIHLSDDDNTSLVLVNAVTFEDYLTCVFASEMGSACPPEFSKAQTVAARSWAVNFLTGKHDGPYTLCNDDDCQRYQGTTHLTENAIQASQQTRGEFVVSKSDARVVAAYYSKSSGGYGEDPALAFQVQDTGVIPALHAPAGKSCTLDLRKDTDFEKWLNEVGLRELEIFCAPQTIPESDLPQYLGAVDEEDAYYRWTYSASSGQILKKIKSEFKVNDALAIKNLTAGPRGVSGRILSAELLYLTTSGEEKTLKLQSEYEIRLALHDSFLYSSAITFSIDKDSDGNINTINFHGAGWGHGVGFCQIGGLGMALKGYDYKQILDLYYPESTLQKSY